MEHVTDHQLLRLIALVNEQQERLGLDHDADVRSQRVNAEGARRWGNRVMDELADHVTRCGMTGEEFVAWAEECGATWLAQHVG